MCSYCDSYAAAAASDSRLCHMHRWWRARWSLRGSSSGRPALSPAVGGPTSCTGRARALRWRLALTGGHFPFRVDVRFRAIQVLVLSRMCLSEDLLRAPAQSWRRARTGERCRTSSTLPAMFSYTSCMRLFTICLRARSLRTCTCGCQEEQEVRSCTCPETFCVWGQSG